MKKRLVLAAVIMLALAILPVATGCTAGEVVINGDTVSGTGTVRRIDLEGGFYGIVGDDGMKYDPVNLAREFQVDGLRVGFEARVRKEQASTRMWGTLIEIMSIQPCSS